MKSVELGQNLEISPENKHKVVQQEAIAKKAAVKQAIKLTLLHPSKMTPVESWSFEDKPIIKIGRSANNHIILNNAVVSRYHVGICREESNWEVINFGANGTYLKGKLITQALITDGMVICLGGSGPQIQLNLVSPSSELMEASPLKMQAPSKAMGNNSFSTYIRY